MSLTVLSASAVLERLHTFDTIIDARSEDEFSEDHLPNAVNWPTLNNEERKDIGTLYKQVNAFEAKKRGAAIAAHNIATHIENHVLQKERDWTPLAYCWRGGKRSGSLSLVLDQIGFRVTLVEGGYKAFRAAMLAGRPEASLVDIFVPLAWRSALFACAAALLLAASAAWSGRSEVNAYLVDTQALPGTAQVLAAVLPAGGDG